jgi:carbonic anhydrase/acetyltransferase-like protein (isoleucine patch superfamily)
MLIRFGEDEPAIDPSAVVFASATVIGRVTVAAEASIWFGAVVRADVDAIAIGARSNVQDRSVIHVTTGRFATRIGEDVTIGHAVVLHGCTIGDRVLVGIGAIVLDGAEVDDDAIVGAGSLVTPGMRIPSGHLALGSPAKVVRRLHPPEIDHLRASAANYARLAARYRELGVA